MGILNRNPARHRGALVTLFLSAFFMCLTWMTEWSLVAEADRLALTAIKLGTAAGIFACALWMWRRRRTGWVYNLILVSIFSLYTFGSSLYRPFYILSLFEIVFLFAICIPHTPRFFWIYASSVFIAYPIWFATRWPHVPELHQHLELADYSNITAQFAAMIAVIYVFFVRAREYREVAELRFALMGKHAARVSHDVKGMLTAPKLYLSQIEERLADVPEVRADVREMLLLSQQHLGEIQRAITELSRLASPDRLPESRFALRDCISESHLMFKNKMHGIHVEIEGDLDLLADRSLVVSVIFNLTTNSVSAIRTQADGDHSIRWTLDPRLRTVTCEDSGGGFAPDALEAIVRGHAYSGFSDGSGMGLQIVRDSVEQMRGRISFANALRGARVTWILPEQILG